MAHARDQRSLERPLELLARHGRSFHFASHFLDRQQATRAGRLYAFCRTVDDLADAGDDRDVARARLRQIARDLGANRRRDPLVADLLALADTTELSVDAAIELVEGVRSDVGRVDVPDVDGLLRYSYRVAGTVGLMMCPLLGVTDDRAHPFAIDLGIAMQLTNIARDVMEDAHAGRRYLPGSWIAGASPETILAGTPPVQARVRKAVRRLVALAEHYYASAEAGLVFLPVRPRLAIAIAARIYRDIGCELARWQFEPWRGRAKVSLARKHAIAASILLKHVGRAAPADLRAEHAAALHRCLIGFPGVNSRFGLAA